MGRVEGWRGRFYEDFEQGDEYVSSLGRTITESDNVWFTNLTLNTNQIHFNADYARRTPFKRPLVNSCFTLALVTGMSVPDVSQNAMANLGWDNVRLPQPLFVGDTVYTSTKVLEKRESRTRPEVGILRVQTKGFNQDGDVVILFDRTIMVYKQGYAPQLELVPEPHDVSHG